MVVARIGGAEVPCFQRRKPITPQRDNSVSARRLVVGCRGSRHHTAPVAWHDGSHKEIATFGVDLDAEPTRNIASVSGFRQSLLLCHQVVGRDTRRKTTDFETAPPPVGELAGRRPVPIRQDGPRRPAPSHLNREMSVRTLA